MYGLSRSPILLVPKLDGSFWVGIDFWRVNTTLRFDAYPMPRVDELLERLGAVKYVSIFALTKGY